MRRPALPAAVAAALLLASAFGMATTAVADPAALNDQAAAPGVLVMVTLTGGGAAARPEYIVAALAGSPLVAAVLPAPPGSEPTSASEAASRLGYDLAVVARVESYEPGRARSSWTIFDALSGEPLSEGLAEGPEPAERDLADYWWLPLVASVEEAAAKILASGQERPVFIVEAIPGTRIRGLGDGVVEIGETGSAMVRLYVPGTYAWSAESAGAYAERGVAAALTRGGTITIPRRPLPSWSAETGLHLGRFPDARASLRFAGDRLFARAGVAQYVAGLRLDEARYGEAPPPVLLSLPYAEAGLGLGAFALAPGARTRPYAVLSAFGRFFWGASPGGLDPSASMGLSLALGAEWPMAPRLAGFVELGAALYPWSDPAAMLDFAEDRGAGTWSLSGERWFFEYPLIRFGARFLP